ncbi:sugar-binding protein [Paenibacillus polymyxa]|uniref:Sugar-binding protein n=1 Tax=Paenibacillus peoriae TaxID=59893 RepID=A0A7H0YBH1_9BACL|nr:MULTISPECIES: sugar-binding protein [Paenibacillus]QNR68429.1 sugar-binding protein [Paenibacillus peoriae]URJ46847.3 sugar-binding protein [Paenibacillus polymyxa]
MSNRKWTFILIPVFLLFAWLLFQFTLSSFQIHQFAELLKTVSPKDGVSDTKVVLISQELDNYYWRSIEQGARKEAEQYGMRLDYIGPDRINPSEQVKLLDKAIASKADAILVQGINDPEYRRLIDKAAGLGIPVITIDTDEPDSRRLAYVGTDNEGAGKRMGALLAKASGERGDIGVMISSERVENQRLRLAGFRSVIGRYPKLRIVEIRSSNISRLQAAQQAQNMLTRYPQIRYMVGFSALDGLGILEASERGRARNLQIFAFDDMAETLKAIRDCKIELTIVQQPEEMGAKSIKLLNDYLKGNTPQELTYTRIYEMHADTPDNMTGDDRR